jgi:hypothetical protein
MFWSISFGIFMHNPQKAGNIVISIYSLGLYVDLSAFVS